MASNYEVNIKLDTKKAKDQLRELEQRIAKLNRLALKGKASKQILKTDRDALALKIKENKLQAQKIKKDRQELKIAKDNLKVEKEKAIAIDRQTRAVEKKTRTISGAVGRPTSRIPLGPSSPLNFSPTGQMLPGPGRTGSGSGASGAVSSAIISGAFPLLFGQGPLIGAAGALGGGIGSMVGGQMGGFAGGLLATSIATPIQQFGIETANLGRALNSLNKETTPLIESLGLVGSNFERQIKIIEKLGDKEGAFELVRQKMTRQIGEEGVNSLSRMGDEAADLTESFNVFMLNMRVGMSNLIEQSGVLRALTRQFETDVAFGRAQREAPNDPEIAKLLNQYQNVGKDRGLFGSIKQGFKDSQADKREKDRILDEITALFKKRDTEKEIKAINDAVNKAAQKKLSTDITLLEKSREKGHLSELEFKIQQKLQELKDKDIVVDEEALANKMRKLDVLEKERKLALETAAAFDKMAQTIATDISKGIQGMIRGTSTLNDMLNNVLNKLIDAAFNMALFGNIQGTLGGGGFFGMFGSFFGKKEKPGKKAADGGRIPGNRASLVGEKGPELFTPATSGYVTPNHALGGSTSISVNVDASGSSVEGNEQNGEEFGRLIAMAIQSELIKEKRPGGLLS